MNTVKTAFKAVFFCFLVASALALGGCGGTGDSLSGSIGPYGDGGAGGTGPVDDGGASSEADGGGEGWDYGWGFEDTGGPAPDAGSGAPDAAFDAGSGVADSGGGSGDAGTFTDASYSDAGAAADAAPFDAGTADSGSPGDSGYDGGTDTGVETCVVSTERRVYYMSADDSNSKASPVIARKMIVKGETVPQYIVRTYEFLNYYAVKYDPPPWGEVNVVPQMLAFGEEGEYALQIGVQAPRVAGAERRPLNITFSLDNSGSMGGYPLDNQKAVLRAIAAELRQGDVVSAVRWNTGQDIRLDSHAVEGPNDSRLMSMIENLRAEGSTDLNNGLSAAYDLANKNYDADAMNRVVVISDGQANVGELDANLIADHAVDNEREAIYLVGVGTGDGYDDGIMDTITDKGKGAYVFIDTEAEAQKQFSGERFVQNFEIAAMNVRLRLDLPPGFKVVDFHGEQISGNPKEIKPQHLAPNSAMIFNQVLGTCPGTPVPEGETFIVTAQYIKPRTYEGAAKTVAPTGAQLLRDGDAKPWAEVVKGNAVIAYAEALKALGMSYVPRPGEVCAKAKAVIENARLRLPGDDDLREIEELLGDYCAKWGY